MSDTALKIKITADTNSAAQSIKNTANEIKHFGVISASAKEKIEILAHSVLAFGGVANAAGGFLKNFAGDTIELNSRLESLSGKLQGLIAANSANITSTGELIDANQKWAMSGEAASAQLASLKQTSQETAFSIDDLASGFSMFYATAANQGSISQANKAFNSIAAAAKVAGKNMSDLVPMFDSLATGSVVAGSEMGAFMRIVGLSNEELKEANKNGRVFDYINEKLAKFKELNALGGDTYESALSRFKSELASLQQELGKPVFDSFKAGLKSAGEFLQNNHDAILNLVQILQGGAKHVAIFAASFAGAKIALVAFNGASNLARAAVANLSASFASGAAASATFKTALIALKTALKTFLPTAIIFGGMEALIAYFNRAAGASDVLANSLSRTSAQIKAMTAAQRENELNELRKAREELLNEQAKFSVRASKGDLISETADFWLGGANERRTANQARADEIGAQIKQIEEQMNRLKSVSKPELVGLKSEIKPEDNADLLKHLKERNRYLIEYYEQRGEINKAWALKEADLRANLAQANVPHAGEIIKSHKDEYLAEFSAKNAKRQVDYYDATGDKSNKRLKERELRSLELKKLGLNDLEIAANLEREETKIAREEELKRLRSKERYYELLGQKARAAAIRNQIQANELKQEGASDEEIANGVYGDERKRDIYKEIRPQNDFGSEFLDRLNQIDTFNQMELDRVNNHYAMLEQSAQNHAAKQREIEQAKMQSTISYTALGFDAAASLAQSFYILSGSRNKSFMRAYQTAMVGKAIVNTYTAASNALATAGNPYLGAALAAVAVVNGMAQVAQIKAQKFHTGGAVGGGALKPDEVNAVLLQGEYVLNREQTRQMKQNASGSNSNNNESDAPIIVNSISPDLFEQWANTRGGRKIIKNIMEG